MKKTIALMILLSVMLSVATVSANAAETDPWVPICDYRAEGEVDTMLPTYSYTEDGLEVVYPSYPDTINPDKGYGSGIVYNKKVDLDGFSVEVRFDEYKLEYGYHVWLAIAFSDDAGFPLWSSPSNGGHIQLYPNATDNSLTVRAYVNENKKQTNMTPTPPKYFVDIRTDVMKISFTKVGDGYKVMLNDAEYDTYNFIDFSRIFPDGKFFPEILFYSSKNAADQEMKFTVLSINGEKPTDPSGTDTTASGTQTTAAPTTTTAPSTFDAFTVVALISVLIPLAGFMVAKKRRAL